MDDRPATPDGIPPDRSPDARAFPDEAMWLQLPPPPPTPTPLPGPGFVDRVVQAIAEERELDRALAAGETDVPRIVLQAFEVPPPSPHFVARTVARLHDERRAHWQQLLARHVAPEPSPQFVRRTLAALRREHDGAPVRRRIAGRRLRRLWAAAAVAAGLLAWLLVRSPDRPVPDLAAGEQPAAYAHAWSDGPGGLVLASHAERNEPLALPAGAPDGIWLAFAEAR